MVNKLTVQSGKHVIPVTIQSKHEPVPIKTTTGSVLVSNLPKYTGSYSVTPRPRAETVLETKDKQMTANLVVREIPYYEVSNDTGGQTIYIPDEVN